ncbi:MAG: DUF3369 domain-containing protein [Leptospiraceae bacterium]|nr:DUF3369 domain-containing protein [Leptospiraceae bacterium]
MNTMTLPESNEDEILFASEEDEDTTNSPHLETWKILIVDDEKEIHSVTKMALADFQFENRKLEFVSAYSGKEAKDILKDNRNFALILLDVVMESDHAGLEVVKYIRKDLGNNLSRIILRTGQPGQAPEEKVILEYDINDYKSKTELTATRLFTTVVASLRAYKDIVTIERSRKGLEKIIQASSSIFEMQTLEKFISGVLTQLVSLLNLQEDSFFGVTSSFATTLENGTFKVIAGTGEYEDKPYINLASIKNPDAKITIEEAIRSKQSQYKENFCVLYFESADDQMNVIFMQTNTSLSDWDKNLLEIFTRNAYIAFHNLHLVRMIIQKELETQKANQEKADFQNKLSRYVSYQVANKIIEENIDLKGERKRVAILFCDIRSFTEISEKLDAQEVVNFLNEYFGFMIDIVFEFGGTLDKFIGDAVMAVYGVPFNLENNEEMAVRSAVKMRELVETYNEGRRKKNLNDIKIGIGIHSGEVIAGNIGSDRRMEYTVVGSTVNIASRIEALNKTFKTDILITEQVYEKTKDIIAVEKQESVLVKGINTPMTTYYIKDLI